MFTIGRHSPSEACYRAAMGKRGPKPKRIVSEEWTPELAYAIGLIATDGNLGRSFYYINLTSKDKEQVENFSRCLGVKSAIGRKGRGVGMAKEYYVIQLKNKIFYNFLLTLGLTPNKSKTLGAINVPKEFFWDFLRGCYDGDGSSYSYWDTRWRSSFMFYTDFVSASKAHIDWLRAEISSRIGISGHISHGKKVSVYQLKYAKSDSLKLLRKMYYSRRVVCLSRKRLKIERILATVGQKL